MSKKESNVEKQEFTTSGGRGTWKESQIDWIIRGVCTVCMYEDFILGICNSRCCIIHIIYSKNLSTSKVDPWYLYLKVFFVLDLF